MNKNPDLHVFTARMPIDEYEAVRAFAFRTRRSINSVFVTALRSYMKAQAGRTERLRPDT